MISAVPKLLFGEEGGPKPVGSIAFTVPAVPVAQPRPRATLAPGGESARMHEVTHIKNANTGDRKAHPIVAFKATVRLTAQGIFKGAPLEGPLRLNVLFVMPRPGNMIWQRRPMPRALHEKRPDLDNLAKSTKDALTGILWRDDSQIAILNARKVIAAGDEQPCVEVQVMQL